MRFIKLLVVAVLAIPGQLQAGEKHHGVPCEDPCGPPTCKMCGKKVCHAEVETAKVKKQVFDVECKEVCIPGIRFPSLFGKKKGDDCTPYCGRVRKVRVLVVKEVEEEVCRCKWKIVDCPEPCGHAGGPCQTLAPESVAPPK